MAVEIQAVVALLASRVPFIERRSPAERLDYLEGVLSRKELKACYELLNEQFGHATKDFGQQPKFDKQTAKVIEKVGGIWTDQCLFFLKIDGNRAIYAALWPWSSDASKVTLKAGVLEI